MLRLVHPAREGQDPPRRKGRRSAALRLTAAEVRHLRAATRNAVKAYGGAAVLAQVIGVPVGTIFKLTAEKGPIPSGTFAIRIARASGTTVEAILDGKLTTAGRCKACGARMGEGRAAS